MAKRGGTGNTPKVRVVLDKRTNHPKHVDVWRNGRWERAEMHVQPELDFDNLVPAGPNRFA